MPRRNLLILFLAALVAVLCHERVQRNPYAGVFADAMTTIEHRSLVPIGKRELFAGAMDGMLQQLDEHSLYLSPEEMADFQDEIDMEHVGLGIRIALDSKSRRLKVLDTLVDSPAMKAGVRAGDVILRIGKATTEGMSLADAVEKLAGRPGEAVTLAVLHQDEKEPVEITVMREGIQEPSVLGDSRNADGAWNFMLDGPERIGYVRIVAFTDRTADELKAAMASLTARNARGLILDLRDDPGGYLDAGIDVCNLFVRSGAIVTTRQRGGSHTFSADGAAPFPDIPIAVLVNQNTASAAEIVAACLQDHHRATIVGQQSYGKGTVQELIRLTQGCGAMKLTTSSYWPPSGRNINRSQDAKANDAWGVSPDAGGKVELDKDEYARWQTWRKDRDAFPAIKKSATKDAKPFIDRQRRRAVEQVKKATKGVATLRHALRISFRANAYRVAAYDAGGSSDVAGASA